MEGGGGGVRKPTGILVAKVLGSKTWLGEYLLGFPSRVCRKLFAKLSSLIVPAGLEFQPLLAQGQTEERLTKSPKKKTGWMDGWDIPGLIGQAVKWDLSRKPNYRYGSGGRELDKFVRPIQQRFSSVWFFPMSNI